MLAAALAPVAQAAELRLMTKCNLLKPQVHEHLQAGSVPAAHAAILVAVARAAELGSMLIMRHSAVLHS